MDSIVDPIVDPIVEIELTYQLVINEVMVGSEVNPEKDHWIEIYNPTQEEISLFGWQVAGVTAGGAWIDVTNEELHVIQPGCYFLLSHYTNSSYSALEVRPQMSKSSIQFPEGDIQVSLRDPEGDLSDSISIPMSAPIGAPIGDEESIIYQSYERGQPFKLNDWSRATGRINLKSDAVNTFATPMEANGGYEMIGEVLDFSYELVDDLLMLFWENPEHEWLNGVNLYQLNEEQDGWDLIENIISETEGEDYNPRLRGEHFIEGFDSFNITAFKITTIDIYNRESDGDEIWIFPEIGVVINEVLPDPKTKETENEFVELWNMGSEPVDLFGWELDDENWEDDKSYFFIDEERDYILEPWEYMIFYKPETLITLGNDGDGVVLYDDEGNEVDSFFFAPDLEGRSWGRNPENLDDWIAFNHPTPGAENIEVNNPPIPIIQIQGDTNYMHINVTGGESYDPDNDDLTYFWDYWDGTTSTEENPKSYTYDMPGEKKITLTITDEYGLSAFTEALFTATEKGDGGGGGSIVEIVQNYPTYLLINEFIPNPEGTDTEGEWIEFFNNTSQSIDLGGWYLDDDEGASSPYKIPEAMVLPPNQFYVFYAPEINLSLKNTEDVVRLLDPNKHPKQIVSYSGAEESLSYAQKLDGSFGWTSLLTPGNFNQFPDPPKSYQEGIVVFESVLPNPDGKDDGLEVVVLKNLSDEVLDLTGWSLADGQNHKTFLESLFLPPRSTHQLSQDVFKFSLNNGEETLFLYDPAGNLIDKISWKDAPSGQWMINLDSLSDGMSASVIRVVDGDTFVMDFMGKQMKVRMIGVDTPETVHPFKPIEFYGRQASDYLKNLLTGKSISLKFDYQKMDKYGRLLAYIYLDDLFVNAEIVKQGYGYAYTRFPFKYLDDFVGYEEEAKENKVGIWENLKVRELIEELIEELLEEPIDELIEEELVVLEEEIPVEGPIEEPIEGPMVGPIVCDSDYLKIDSFLPDNEKGMSVEYIRLVNTGPETVCLYGWSLDDILDGGSKPFSIRGGSIASGAMRTFRKSETKLALNNGDDCVNLINPNGEIADQICYEKTHKNEIFTHLGGDWKPQPRKKKSSTSTKSKSQSSGRYTFDRQAISYKWEFESEKIIGNICEIDEENEVLYLELDDRSIIPVSYASSSVNVAMAKQLLDLSEPVEVQVYGSELVAINQASFESDVTKNPLSNIYYIIGLNLIAATLLFIRKKCLAKFN
ncbi:lamin tail domain-containing protein [Patescibacteria group bacterium]|nr:lamin tail domain-containing protein [Patescibacteria group bacterium]